MDLISINTTQNVNLLTEKAGVGRRVLAILLDYVIEGGAVIAFFYFMGTFSFSPSESYNSFVAVFISLFWFFYHFLFEVFTEGQSVGKIVTKIRVVRSTGERASIYQYFIRALLRPIDMIFGLGLLVMVFNVRGQRLGDIAADTIVISIDAKVTYQDMIITDIEENYVPLLDRAKIEKLAAKDVELIKQVVSETYRTLDYSMLGLLHTKVLTVLDVKSEMLPVDFLQRVVKDYNYYA